MKLLATFKHISSKNADYGAAEQYLTFEHDEFTMKPTLDENGQLVPREDYRFATLNCGEEDFAVACMRSNLHYGKNQKREDVKSHHYIISFDPRDGTDNGLTVDKAQSLGEEFCREHFPGHQAIVCTHPDGHNHSGNIHDPTYNKWHPSTVLRILNSSTYIGELVSGKTQTASYKGIGLHPVEKREWHIVENAHEAIILKSDFEKVQARREQNKEKRERAMARSKATREKCYNHLSGMVYCGCCRRNMTFERRVHGTVKETHYGVFICKRKKNTTPCAYHAVPEKMLMMVAMDQIHHLVSTMCEEEKMVKDMMRGSNLDSARSIKMKENSILFRIQEAEERRLRLYEDYKAEILDEDEYSQLKEHYIAEKQRLEHELQKQRQRALELEKRIKICDAQMERMRGFLNQSEFDEELVHELIKKVYVGMDNSVEVEFKCSDPYQEVLAIMSEVQNE